MSWGAVAVLAIGSVMQHQRDQEAKGVAGRADRMGQDVAEMRGMGYSDTEIREFYDSLSMSERPGPAAMNIMSALAESRGVSQEDVAISMLQDSGPAGMRVPPSSSQVDAAFAHESATGATQEQAGERAAAAAETAAEEQISGIETGAKERLGALAETTPMEIETARQFAGALTAGEQEAARQAQAGYGEAGQISADYTERAAQAALGAGGEGSELVMGQFAQGKAGLDPYTAAGAEGLAEQRALLGLGTPEEKAAAMAKFEESPGQKFLRQQQEKATLRSAAATGGLRGGNVQTALQEQAYGRAATQLDKQIADMASLAQRGQVAETDLLREGGAAAGRAAEFGYRGSEGASRAYTQGGVTQAGLAERGGQFGAGSAQRLGAYGAGEIQDIGALESGLITGGAGIRAGAAETSALLSSQAGLAGTQAQLSGQLGAGQQLLGYQGQQAQIDAQRDASRDQLIGQVIGAGAQYYGSQPQQQTAQQPPPQQPAYQPGSYDYGVGGSSLGYQGSGQTGGGLGYQGKAQSQFGGLGYQKGVTPDQQSQFGGINDPMGRARQQAQQAMQPTPQQAISPSQITAGGPTREQRMATADLARQEHLRRQQSQGQMQTMQRGTPQFASAQQAEQAARSEAQRQREASMRQSYLPQGTQQFGVSKYA